MEANYLSESDLERLINEKLDNCVENGYSNICQLIKTETGKERVIKRVKEIIFNDNIPNIDSALANVETELRFEEE